MAVRAPCICLVTDRRRLATPTDEELVRLAAGAAAAGVDLIQLREHGRDARDLLILARRVVNAVMGTQARVVVNERTDIAVAAGAAGVHLRGDSPGADRVRAIVPADFLVGRSVHGVRDAVRAAATGVDYLIMGTVYPTSSKNGRHPIAGIDTLREVCGAVSIPVLAIGGVTADNVGDLMDAGASGIAAIGLFVQAFDASPDDQRVRALSETIAALKAKGTRQKG